MHGLFEFVSVSGTFFFETKGWFVDIFLFTQKKSQFCYCQARAWQQYEKQKVWNEVPRTKIQKQEISNCYSAWTALLNQSFSQLLRRYFFYLFLLSLLFVYVISINVINITVISTANISSIIFYYYYFLLFLQFFLFSLFLLFRLIFLFPWLRLFL